MTTTEPLALAVADASWITTENLFRQLDDPAVSVLALRCMDYRNGWRKGIRPWSASRRTHRVGERAWAKNILLPPGWMKRFPEFGMRPIARAIRRFWERRPGDRRGLVVTYPHYRHLIDLARPDATLYYNMDDYIFYWPEWVEPLRRLEYELIERSASTVCVGLNQAEAFRRAVPSAASRIHHIPTGRPPRSWRESPCTAPAPRRRTSLGYPARCWASSARSRTDSTGRCWRRPPRHFQRRRS